MSYTKTCARNHVWESAEPDSACPVCTSSASTDGPGDTDLPAFADDLPPLPARTQLASGFLQQELASPSSVPSVEGFEIHSELGRGGMGVVYRARSLRLNRIVALKMILAGGHADPQTRQRFRGEAEAVAKLQHPNIVQIFELGEQDGLPYFVLEYVDGGSLAQKLAGKPMPAREAAEMAETLARAVHYAHERGIVHRDLKPANVLIADGGWRMADSESKRIEANRSRAEFSIPQSAIGNPQLKIADFGLAKQLDAAGLTASGEVLGTPCYMAPEQASGQWGQAGLSIDVYALGTILYEMLTGRPPFLAATSPETIRQLLNDDPVPITRLQPRTPRDLETIALKCLHKEPAKRYASALELADDLERFREGRPILARRTPWWEQAAKWARRRPAVAALIAVMIVTVIAIASLLYANNRNLTRHNKELEQANIRINAEKIAADLARDESDRQRRRAYENLAHAVNAVEQMLERVGLKRLAGRPAMDQTRVQLLEDAIRFLDRIVETQPDEPSLKSLQVLSFSQSAWMHFLLGRFDQAQTRFEKAFALLEELRRIYSDTEALATLNTYESLLRTNRGLLYSERGKWEEAQADHDAALGLFEKMAANDPEDYDTQSLMAASYLNRAIAARAQKDAEGAVLNLNRAEQRCAELVRKRPWNAKYAVLQGIILSTQGTLALDDDRPIDAVPLLEKALDKFKKLSSLMSHNVDLDSEIARCISNLGMAWRRQGYWKRAAEFNRQALEIRQKLVRDHPDVRMLELDLYWSHWHIGELHRAKKEWAAAIASFSMIIAKMTAKSSDARDSRRLDLLRNAYHCRGAAYEQSGERDKAIVDLEQEIKLTPETERPGLRIQLAIVLAFAGQFDRAIAETNELLKQPSPSAELLFDAARVFAISAHTSKDEASSKAYAEKSVSLLTQAKSAGHFRKRTLRETLSAHPEFSVLQGRADFEALRAK